MGGSFGIENTQVVPYYVWQKAGIGYGNFNNDYAFNQGAQAICDNTSIEVIGYQQGNLYPRPNPTPPEGDHDGDWSTPSFYGGDLRPQTKDSLFLLYQHRYQTKILD